MSKNLVRLAIEFSLCCGLLHQPNALLQSPGFGGGRLVINSLPAGANILINDKPQQQLTNSTYVVGKGSYKISVTGGPGNLHCADRSVSVTSGNTTTVTCAASGWQ